MGKQLQNARKSLSDTLLREGSRPHTHTLKNLVNKGQMNATILKRKNTNSQQICEKCSASFPIREMQIKTVLRFHLIPASTAVTKNADDGGDDDESCRIWEINLSTLQGTVS